MDEGKHWVRKPKPKAEPQVPKPPVPAVKKPTAKKQ